MELDNFFTLPKSRVRAPAVVLLIVVMMLGAVAPIFLSLFVLRHELETQELRRLQTNMNVAWNVLQDNGAPRLVDGVLYAGARPLRGDQQVIKQIIGLVGGSAAVLQGDQLLGSNLHGANGKPIPGSMFLPAGPVRQALLIHHAPFRGPVRILGTGYFAGYDPIFDPAGAMIGILFVGETQRLGLRAGTVTDLATIISSAIYIVLLSCCLTLVAKRLLLKIALQKTSLTQVNRQLDVALSNMSQGLCLYDGQTRLVMFNRRFIEITGVDEHALHPGMTFDAVSLVCLTQWNFPAPADPAEWQRAQITAAGPAVREEAAMPGGRILSICHEPVPGGGFVQTYTDVTLLRQTETQVAFMAAHDTLTGLANRVLLRERLDLALTQISRGHMLTVLCLDLDHFKIVNDTLGHMVGDKLLCMVAERLGALMGHADTVARLGSDEFAIIQSDASRIEDAAVLCERLIAAISAPYLIDGQLVVIGACIGVAAAPVDGDTGDVLLKNADIALYRAKSDGKSSYSFFEPEMDARLQARRVIESELREALQEGAFEVHYQPLINLESDRITSFEALVRWRHKTRGLVPPIEFIPVAEEMGLIIQLGEWVMRRACKDAAGWPRDIGIAVNLSVVQFKSRMLVEMIRGALADSGLSPARLEVEITEGLFLKDDEFNLQILHELRNFGVRVSMDDFGTGYSSLSYLRSFPFDKIKIDRSFINEMTERPDSVAIIRAAIGLGISLGIKTTAEGVETREQLSKLRAEGCSEVQGYLLGRPVPAAEVPAMIGARNEMRLAYQVL